MQNDTTTEASLEDKINEIARKVDEMHKVMIFLGKAVKDMQESPGGMMSLFTGMMRRKG